MGTLRPGARPLIDALQDVLAERQALLAAAARIATSQRIGALELVAADLLDTLATLAPPVAAASRGGEVARFAGRGDAQRRVA